MEISYLTWFKNLELQLHNKTDIFPLMSSAVSEPTEMLLADLRQFQEIAPDYINNLNTWGHALLKERLAGRFEAKPANIVITNGASNGIYLTCRALLEKGDHVIIETPCYEPLRASPAYIGADISYIARRPFAYQIDLDELIDLIRPKTKLIIITNLHNPSGALIDNNLLLEMAQAARMKSPDIKIMVDEIYHDFLPQIPKPAAGLDDCFITLSSLTKVYGLGIIHCGWIIAERATTNKILNLQTMVEGSGSRLLESLATFIVEQLDKYHRRSINSILSNLEILSQYLQPLTDKGIIEGQLPEFGCVYFPGLKIGVSTETLVCRLAEKYSVYIVPGKYFNEPTHIRLGFGGPRDKLESALAKFSEALTGLALT